MALRRRGLRCDDVERVERLRCVAGETQVRERHPVLETARPHRLEATDLVDRLAGDVAQSRIPPASAGCMATPTAMTLRAAAATVPRTRVWNVVTDHGSRLLRGVGFDVSSEVTEIRGSPRSRTFVEQPVERGLVECGAPDDGRAVGSWTRVVPSNQHDQRDRGCGPCVRISYPLVSPSRGVGSLIALLSRCPSGWTGVRSIERSARGQMW